MVKQATPLHLFRSTPPGFMERPPLCSSFQNLESSFFMLALHRYPHALVACASAIESCLTAALQLPASARPSATQLYSQATTQFPGLQKFDSEKLRLFREKRNSIVHYGFTVEDDPKSAGHLLEIGFPFLGECYRECFTFDLNAGLLGEESDCLRNAIQSYADDGFPLDLDVTAYFVVFEHQIRWRFRDNFSTAWERDATRQADETLDYLIPLDRYKDEIERDLGTACSLDCPICDHPDALMCKLDDGALESRRLLIKQVVCAYCHLKIPECVSSLANLTCQQQLAENTSFILSEFGLEEDH